MAEEGVEENLDAYLRGVKAALQILEPALSPAQFRLIVQFLDTKDMATTLTLFMIVMKAHTDLLTKDVTLEHLETLKNLVGDLTGDKDLVERISLRILIEDQMKLARLAGFFLRLAGSLNK